MGGVDGTGDGVGVHSGAGEVDWGSDAAGEVASEAASELASEAASVACTGDGAKGDGEQSGLLFGTSRAATGSGITAKARTPSSFSGTPHECIAAPGLTAPSLLVLDRASCRLRKPAGVPASYCAYVGDGVTRGVQRGIPLGASSEPEETDASRLLASSVSVLPTEVMLDGVQLRRCAWLCAMNDEEHARGLRPLPKGVPRASCAAFPTTPDIAALYGESSTPKSLTDVLRAPCGVMGVDGVFETLLLPRRVLMRSEGAPGTAGDAARLEAELVDNGGVVPLPSLLQLQRCELLRWCARRAGTAMGKPAPSSESLQKVQKCKLLGPTPILLIHTW